MAEFHPGTISGDALTALFARLFAYDRWANEEVVNALAMAEAAPRPALAKMHHIVAAEELWLARVQGQAPPGPIWPERELAETATRCEAIGRRWARFIADLPVGDFFQPIEYRNSEGLRFQSIVHDALTHVVTHASYHRGQIATLLDGHTTAPLSTDFIVYSRTPITDS